MYQIRSSFHLDGYLESRIGGRAENQDACGFSDTPVGALVVVCDGMGGMQGGSVASSVAVKTIISCFSDVTKEDDPLELIKTAVSSANTAILEAASADPNLEGMGTTLVLVLINEDCAYVVSIGDSRVYQLRSKKKVFRTEDDSVVFQLVKTKTITEEEARTSKSSNIITKALGISKDLEYDIHPLSYRKRDRFVLCTDGYWNSMPEAELLQMINRKGELSRLFESALNKVEKIGKENNPDCFDNYTAAVFDVGVNSKKSASNSIKRIVISVICCILLLLSLLFSFYLYRSRTQGNIIDDAQDQVEKVADIKDTVATSPAPFIEDQSQEIKADTLK